MLMGSDKDSDFLAKGQGGNFLEKNIKVTAPQICGPLAVDLSSYVAQKFETIDGITCSLSSKESFPRPQILYGNREITKNWIDVKWEQDLNVGKVKLTMIFAPPDRDWETTLLNLMNR